MKSNLDTKSDTSYEGLSGPERNRVTKNKVWGRGSSWDKSPALQGGGGQSAPVDRVYCQEMRFETHERAVLGRDSLIFFKRYY